MFVHINEFPDQLKQEITLVQRVPLFAHTNFVMKIGRSNFGGRYYESIGSPYLLWKFYCRKFYEELFLMFHFFIFPLLMSGIDMNCRDFTARTTENCSGLGKIKVKAIFFREMFDFSIKLSEFCFKNVNSEFIIDVPKRYKKGEYYFSSYLDIEDEQFLQTAQAVLVTKI